MSLGLDDQEIIKLYCNNNQTLTNIARLMGCHRSTICRHLERLGKKRPNPEKKPPIDPVELKRLYWEEELSTYQVAQRLGYSQRYINKKIKQTCGTRTLSQAIALGYRKGERRKRRGRYEGKVKIRGYFYIHMPRHPRANHHGYIAEHRLVMEKKLGRYLLPWEKVHHIDGDRGHNTEDNLKLISPADHTLYAQMCAHCPLRKEVRLLRWQIKQLQDQLQFKMMP